MGGERKSKMKQKVTFNYYGENQIFWTDTLMEKKAIRNCMNQLADKMGVTSYSIRQYFASRGNKITVEKEN